MNDRIAGALVALVLAMMVVMGGGCGGPYAMLQKGLAYGERGGEPVYAKAREHLKKRCRKVAISKECKKLPPGELKKCKPWAECDELRTKVLQSFQLYFAGIEAVSEVAPKIKEVVE